MGQEIRKTINQTNQPHRKMSIKVAEKGMCVRCRHQESTHSHECKVCHYLTLAMVTIHGIWKESELPQLIEQLERESVKNFIASAKQQGAFLRHKLGDTIFRLSYPAGLTPDEFKRRLVACIEDYLREMEGIREYEARPGCKGQYMKHWVETVASWVSKAQTRSAT